MNIDFSYKHIKLAIKHCNNTFITYRLGTGLKKGLKNLVLKKSIYSGCIFNRLVSQRLYRQQEELASVIQLLCVQFLCGWRNRGYENPNNVPTITQPGKGEARNWQSQVHYKVQVLSATSKAIQNQYTETTCILIY